MKDADKRGMIATLGKMVSRVFQNNKYDSIFDEKILQSHSPRNSRPIHNLAGSKIRRKLGQLTCSHPVGTHHRQMGR